MGSLLRVDKLSKRFGGLAALNEVSFEIAEGQVVGIIGPNGSGKTTLFNVISGLLPADSGDVYFAGERITGLPPHRVAAHGLARSFQSTRLFSGLTLLENVELPQYTRSKVGLFAALARLPAARGERRRVRARAEAMLREVGSGRLYERRHTYPIACSLGEQRILETARILVASPRLILFDEPTQGLNPVWIEEVMATIRAIKSQGVTIAIIEHKMSVLMELSDRVVVMAGGQKIAEGTPDEVQRDPLVIAAYLGD